MGAWTGKSVVVTGGTGFLGKHLVRQLRAAGAQVRAPSSRECDLLRPDHALRLLEGRVDAVFHLAARVGGIGANRNAPGTFFRDNLLMGIHVLEACRTRGVRRLVQVGTVCSYPKIVPVPFREENLFDGFPEETNAPYGIAKRALLVGSSAYAKEFGLEPVNLLVLNLYGEEDHFDLATSHVIPALVRKCIEAEGRGSRLRRRLGRRNADARIPLRGRRRGRDRARRDSLFGPRADQLGRSGRDLHSRARDTRRRAHRISRDVSLRRVASPAGSRAARWIARRPNDASDFARGRR